MPVTYSRVRHILTCINGEPEMKAMSMMGYEAGTIGNHDFDAGIENLAEKISSHASFPFIICNYDFIRYANGTSLPSI